MKKKYYIAVCCKDCGTEYAFIKEWRGNNNLSGAFDDPRILSANICDSKSEAMRIVNGWNDEFRKAGIFKFA